MARIEQDLADLTLLDELTAVHDGDVLADLGDHGQVVRDEHQADAGLAAQPRQQAQDLVLDGDVERGGRLVAQDDLRVAGQRDRDHHALPHAARELVRVGPEPPLRVGDAHPAHQLERALGRPGPAEPEVHLRPFGYLSADPHHRVERAHRLLEDHGHLRAAQTVDVGAAQLHQVHPVQPDLTGRDLRLGRQHAEDGAQRHALAGTGLAHQAEGAAPGYVEGHPVHRPDDAAAAGDPHVQVADLEDRLGPHRAHWPGLSRSARPSPTSDRPSPTMTTARPGMVVSCQWVDRKFWPSLIIDPRSAVGGGMPRPKYPSVTMARMSWTMSDMP